MATKSILKSVDIRGKKMSKGFVSALENAHNKKAQEVVLSKPCESIRKQDIKKIFGE